LALTVFSGTRRIVVRCGGCRKSTDQCRWTLKPSRFRVAEISIEDQKRIILTDWRVVSDRAQKKLAHVPEEWEPVFRTEHAQNRRI
jgi:hypothetical protein